MTEKQQELYEKLLKKINEYCLGYAAEDVIAAIDALVDTYEQDQAYATLYSQALEIIKKHIDIEYWNDLTQEEYELLKEILDNGR